MGQSYKGAEATFIDNAMFKLPYELMAQVIEKKDKGVQQDLDAAVALKDKLKAQALKVDQPALKQKILDYTQRIDDITAGIKGNVMDYSRFSDQTNQLSRDITQDWTMGDIYTMESNRTSYLENVKELEDAYKKDPSKFRAGQLEALKAAALAKYKGYKNPETGEYNTYTDATLYGTDPLTEHVDKAMKGAVGEFQEIETDNESGMWRIKSHDKWQGWKPLTELKPIWDSYLKNNPNIDLALGQVEELGLGNRKQEETKAFDYLFSKYGKRKVLESDSKTLSEEGKLKTAKKIAEPDMLIVKDEVVTTTNTSTGASLFKTVSQANSDIKNIQTEISQKLSNNIPEKVRSAILKGDPTAIRAYFNDPETAEKYINQFNDAYVKKNMAKGAINGYNQYRKEKGLSLLPTNPSKWTQKDTENFNLYQGKKGIGATAVTTGAFSFPEGTTKATRDQYQKTVEQEYLNGEQTFTLNSPVPSIKYKSARVMPYDPNNPASKNIVKGNMKVTYQGKDYWYNVNQNYWNRDTADGTNYPSVGIPVKTKGGKTETKQIPLNKIGLKNVVMYEPVVGGDISMTWLNNNGHMESVQDSDKGTFIYGANPEKPGEKVKLSTDQNSFTPSTIRNQKGNFTGRGHINMGSSGEGLSFTYDSDRVSTEKMRQQQQRDEEDSKLSLQQSKGGFDKNYYDEFNFEGTKGIIKDGKYYLMNTQGQLQEIQNKETRKRMEKESLLKRD